MKIYSGFNLIAIAFLAIISLMLIGLHRIGFMNIELQIAAPGVARHLSEVVTPNVNYLTFSDHDTLKIKCQIKEIKPNTLCGASILLWHDDLTNGLNLDKYDSVKLNIEYKTPNAQSKVRVSFRNFNSKYSIPKDFVSLKYNSITYQPAILNKPIIVPLNAFRVEQWWIEQLNLGFDDANLDFSNISMYEVVANNIKTPGEYEISIINTTLYGEAVTEANMLKILLFIWLLSATVLTARQRNILKKYSITDELTGLLNRRGVSFWVGKKLNYFTPSDSLWMFYLDLDDFKKINDSYGHRVGDKVLQVFAKTLKQNLQGFSKHNYAISRLSGDEFALILKHQDNQKIQTLVNTFYNDILQLFEIDDYKIKISVSIGIAHADDKMTSFENFIAKADSAMYFAKRKGKNQFQFFDQEVAQGIAFGKDIAERIGIALKNDEFILNYMPILNVNDLKICRVEVLLRCTSDKMKGIGPEIFIPIAEKFELIKDIDLWVIESTFKNIESNRAFLLKNPIVFCINLSGTELKNDYFTPQLASLIKQYNIDPGKVELEITETTLVEVDDRTIGILNEIKGLGVALALDDFGTGYTAFGQLMKYPVSCLKIDKSFIDGLITQDKAQATMVDAILSIAHAYDLEIIAEGVEELGQYHYLSQRGCDMIQGYFLSKPLQWNDFLDFYRAPYSEVFKPLSLISNNNPTGALSKN